MPNFIATAKHAAMAALRLTPPKETPAEAGAHTNNLRQVPIVPNPFGRVYRRGLSDGLLLGLVIGLELAAVMLLIGGGR